MSSYLEHWDPYTGKTTALSGDGRLGPQIGHGIHTQQSGRSPKVVALFLQQTLVAIEYDQFQLHDTIQMKSNEI